VAACRSFLTLFVLLMMPADHDSQLKFEALLTSVCGSVVERSVVKKPRKRKEKPGTQKQVPRASQMTLSVADATVGTPAKKPTAKPPELKIVETESAEVLVRKPATTKGQAAPAKREQPEVKSSKPATRPTPTKVPARLVLTHEDGVDWKLDCYYGEHTDDDGDFSQAALEACKLELLKRLRQEDVDEAGVKEIRLLAALILHFGGSVPDYVLGEANRALVESDPWCDEEELDYDKIYAVMNTSYLWMFYYASYPQGFELFDRKIANACGKETSLQELETPEALADRYPIAVRLARFT